MQKEILRVRLTHNVKQLKKYVDKAIELGAEIIKYDMDNNNPYLNFMSDFTPEERHIFEIQKLKEELEKRLKQLESLKLKTYRFRIKNGLSEYNTLKLIDNFKEENNISNQSFLPKVIKQVITNEYDDFEDDMQTVILTEVINIST
jgi:hypothetical protein